MTPFPAVYCPPDMPKPACCPHLGGVGLAPGKGPDADHKQGPGGGTIYGGLYMAGEGTWQRTPAGWWVCMQGQRPQDLVRMDTHPRVASWIRVPGARPGDWWRVPLLLVEDGPTPEGADKCYVSALDRVWTGQEWGCPQDLAPIQEALLCVANHIALADDLGERNAQFRKLAIDLVSLGHWVDLDLMVVNEWLTERVMVNLVAGAYNDLPEPADEA